MSTALNVTHLRSRPGSEVKATKSLGRPIVGMDGIAYFPHPNGGGLVAETARVACTVFVAPTATVRGRAMVSGWARLLDESVVEGNARVSGNCTLRHHAYVGEQAVLSGSVTVANHASVVGRAYISGTAYIEYYATVGSECWIVGDLRVS
jgi:acyl-[acyl carrier protein]--UDP-N-acetylglucosamine O-acyltransferase